MGRRIFGVLVGKAQISLSVMDHIKKQKKRPFKILL
ncbi:MAG: hypothetical protein CM1200mP16_08150 [Nitrospina sp.]|nr:MAG: hypothetical protein CM1200mP16_08150 [Nitrospina sp.]